MATHSTGSPLEESLSRQIPAFPGAHHIFAILGDWASFQTSACSRPPPPTTRTFMDIGRDGITQTEAKQAKAIHTRITCAPGHIAANSWLHGRPPPLLRAAILPLALILICSPRNNQAQPLNGFTTNGAAPPRYNTFKAEADACSLSLAFQDLENFNQAASEIRIADGRIRVCPHSGLIAPTRQQAERCE